MPKDAPVNTGAHPDGPVGPRGRVSEMQAKLHRWAAADPGRRFDDLFNFVHDLATLIVAFDRRAVNARGNFPSEQVAIKCLYLTTMALDPTGKERARWTNQWKAVLNAFEITFNGRLATGYK
jgi:hypothetical protein